MKCPLMILSLGLCALVGAQDTSLLDDREWKSSDGQPLQAELVQVEGDWITLKRKKDNRSFKLSVNRLSVEDRALLEKCVEGFNEITKPAEGNPGVAGTFFSGFANPGEDFWELARRFGRADDLWAQATRRNWFYSVHNAQRIIRIKTQRIERISDVEYFVHGRYVSLKVRLDSPGDQFSFHGQRLMRTDTFGRKSVVAEKDADFIPKLGRENLLSFGMEKIGVTEKMVMTVSLRR